ncbi:ABC transporter permease [Campylobacterota bacterium]
MLKTTYIHLNKNIFMCSNSWITQNIAYIEKELDSFDLSSQSTLKLDLSQLKECDVNGAIFIHGLLKKLRRNKISVFLINVSPYMQNLLDITLLSDSKFSEKREEENFFSYVGRSSYNVYLAVKEYMTFIGELSFTIFYLLRYPFNFRMNELFRSIQEHSIKALPIVLLTSALIGLVIAYQSALQIRKYGADIFVVDMLIISVTRELAPLITAIVIAGRSGSAYTAEIGVMKLTEEIDAMETMGFNPFRFLVLPNILALMIALPMIIFLADIVGILGGMLAAKLELGITTIMFVNRFEEVFDINDLYVGLIKGPVFAFIIASIGSMRGLAVENSTDSIGANTKTSVVSAIFIVIICDAIFSIIFMELGI